MELNKAMLDCMQQLRRKLRAEQNLVIRLSDPDAVTFMLAACLKSNDEEIRQLGRQLAELSSFWTHPNQGAAVSAAQTPAPAAAPTPAAETDSHTKVRIYRGQRIYG